MRLFHVPRRFVLALSLAAASPLVLPALALDPSKPPSGNFDLSHWKLTLPVTTSGSTSGTPAEIQPSDLSNDAYYTQAPYTTLYEPYFFTSSTDGTMVFHCPTNGAKTTNTSYPRCELREMLNPTDDTVNWTDVGTHTLTTTARVTSLPTSGKIIVGQIHGTDASASNANPLVKLQFEPSGSGYRLRALCKQTATASTDDTMLFPGTTIALNSDFTYVITLKDKTLKLVVNGVIGTISGKTANADGSYAMDPSWDSLYFYFKAGNYNQDSSGDSSVAEVRISAVSAVHGTAPVITTTSLASGRTTIGYSQQLGATGGTTPYTWSISSGSLPAGLSLSSAGLISGTPTTAQTANFTALVTDSGNQTDTQALSITIAANSVPSITTTSLPGGTAGVAYSQSVASTGGDGALIWSVSSGSLPAGLALSNVNSQNCTISGTPSTAGTANFTLALADVDGDTATQALSIAIGTPAQVAAPSFTPGGGTYSSAQTVTISSTTSGASIRYTVDGSTPSETNGTLYSAPITIASTCTLQAIAYESGMTDSSIASAAYTINAPPQVAAPSFTPGGGTYSSAQTVTISSTTSGASIRYTIDGSTPSETNGTLYSGSVTISATSTLNAIAYESGMTDSTVTSATYTIGSSGSVTATANGSWQNTAMAAQSGVFSVTFDAVPSASPNNAVVGLSLGSQTAFTGFACLVRFNTSGDIDVRNGGSYTAAATVPFSANTTYHFRLVVDVPSHTYSVYVTVAGGSEQTLATNYAFRTEQNTVASLDNWGAFVDTTANGGAGTLTVSNFTPQVATPSFSPAGGSYSSTQTVTISSTTSGASIRYTVDGSTPSEANGTLYTGPVTISASSTLQALAYESGMTDSSVASASYTIGSSGSGSATATANGSWQNTGMATQSGVFSVAFDAVPSASPNDAVVGLSLGAQTAYTGFACLVRFNTSGDIDVRNGGSYAAAATVPFSANTSYHFRLVVNVPSHTYSVYVTPAGGSEQTLASNYAFRTEQNTVASLDNWGAFVDTTANGGAGTLTVSSFTAQVATPSFSPAGGSYSSTQTVTISSATAGASIRYTLDGSTPSETNGTLYSGPVTVSATATLNAIAYEAGLTDSAVASAAYTIGANTVPVIMEAESVSFDSNWSNISDSNAYGGHALQALSNSTSSAPSNGGLVYSFTLSSSSTIYIQTRSRSPNGGSSDSFWLRLDGGSWQQFVQGGTNTYTWSAASFSSVASGAHTFEIRYREASAVLDEVAVTLNSSAPN